MQNHQELCVKRMNIHSNPRMSELAKAEMELMSRLSGSPGIVTLFHSEIASVDGVRSAASPRILPPAPTLDFVVAVVFFFVYF